MKPSQAPVHLSRAVNAILIPDGTTFTLDEGTEVRITQALGGSITVAVASGTKFRIAGDDADALGMVSVAGTDGPHDEANLALDEASVKARCWDALRTVHDPEIPIDVVELGLVYEVALTARPGGGGPAKAGTTAAADALFDVHVRMTLTAPGCGMGDVLLADARRAIGKVVGVGDVVAEITFNPVWNPNTMMSEAARLQLGLL